MSSFKQSQLVLIDLVRKECAENPWMLRHIVDAATSGPEAAIREANEAARKAQTIALFAYNAATAKRTKFAVTVTDSWLREELQKMFPNAFKE